MKVEATFTSFQPAQLRNI